MQITCEVPEVSGAGTQVPEVYGSDIWLGSRGFWCRYLVRFWKVPVQLPDEVPEGLGEDAW